MPETEAMVLNQARFGPCRAHPFPMNVDVGMSPFNWMFCDPNTMAVWKKEGGKDDYSLLVNRVCLSAHHYSQNPGLFLAHSKCSVNAAGEK